MENCLGFNQIYPQIKNYSSAFGKFVLSFTIKFGRLLIFVAFAISINSIVHFIINIIKVKEDK